MFYVLDGAITVLAAGVEHELRAGGFAAAPPGVVHTFSNPGGAPARILNFSAPGGFEDYVRELAEASAGGPPAPERMADIFARHDVEVVDAGEPSPPGTVRPPGEAERLEIGGSPMWILAGAEDTAGRLFLAESVVAPGFPGPPLHRHSAMTDMFWVLQGTLTLRVEEEAVELPAGGFACAPPGVAHTFSNPRGEPVRMLNLSTPAGFERYMRELAAAFSGGTMPTSEAIGAIASRYDVQVVPGG